VSKATKSHCAALNNHRGRKC